MRRAGGWALGFCIVAAMAGGGWVALRPLFTRETVTIGYFRSATGRDPSNDAMFSGAQFALEEAGGRAGRFRMQLADFKTPYSKLPMIWIGTSEALLEQGEVRPERFKISALETHPEAVDFQDRILTGCYDQGIAAGRWMFECHFMRPLLLADRVSERGKRIADGCMVMFNGIHAEWLNPPGTPAQQDELVQRALIYKPDLIFFAGEDAPYGASEALFTKLRTQGYTGLLAMADADPEVSFLAVPARLPEGTRLISPIGPPSKEFAAKYEPATGRHAGPHGWVGYLAAKRALKVIERSRNAVEVDFSLSAWELGRVPHPCVLYIVRNGKFEFVQDLK
jgi:hypothetical protein